MPAVTGPAHFQALKEPFKPLISEAFARQGQAVADRHQTQIDPLVGEKFLERVLERKDGSR